MSKAFFILVLHAHMPYVLDIRFENTLEERWLYEAVVDCYLRLIQTFDRLMTDGIPFGLTISISPVLLAQLENPLFIRRFIKYLNLQIDLTEKEILRTIRIPELAPLAKMYNGYYRDALRTFEERCNYDIIQTFRSFQDMGALEIITCAATHAYLPLLRPALSGIRTQVTVAKKEYKRIFGRTLSGLWLPECGYFPGLDTLLLQAGIKYTFLDTHTIQSSEPIPEYAAYAPIISPSGMVAFGRDVHTAKEVWSSMDGYPGDSDYRDFYRDIGFDLDLDYVGAYLPGEVRSYTGLKYYRIKKNRGQNRIYVPEIAERKVSIHTDDFLAHRLKQVRDLSLSMGFPPVICALYDAELFGHWWFEGPSWLEMLFRKIFECGEYFTPVKPSDYLKQKPMLQRSQPQGGSWGWKGYNEVWINEKNSWVYPHLFKAAEKMEALAVKSGWNVMEERALNQAGKELLLAQSSDWTFILHNETLSEYATKRIKEHLGRFWKLIHQIETCSIKEDWLCEVETQDNIFPSFNYKDFL
ncbi:MAG: glycoside hydrolase family 57 protein [bacterium]